MRLYFKDDDHYPATYSFKDDEDGTEPTDWVTNNDTDCTTTVISDLDGHKKVLQVFDDSNAGDCEMTVQFSKEADTTVEFWIRQDSVAVNTIFKFFLFEDASWKIYILWQNDDISYNDGAWHDLKLNCQAADTWYHIKIVCDDSANTYDFYLDGILEGDNLPYRVNTTTGLNKIQINTDNADNGYNIYIDALGLSVDTDYTIGDNIQPWDWTRVSNVISFPDLTTRNNIHGMCSITLRDFEGGLYSTWEPRDFIDMIITDDSGTYGDDCNILFRGILTNKRFHSKDLILEISGIGIHLLRNSFGTDEEENYILEEGFVKGTPGLLHSSKLYLQDGDLNDFTYFDDDYWTSNERNVGIIIKDTTPGYGTTTWDAESITMTGRTSIGTESGAFGDTTGFDDGDEYHIKIQLLPGGGLRTGGRLYATPVIEGVVIDGTDPGKKELQSIKIEWNYKMRMFVYNVIATVWVTCQLQIYNTDSTEWEDIPGGSLYMWKDWPGLYGSGWCQAVSVANGGTGNEYILKKTDTTPLEYYFDKVGGDYDHLSGLRLNILYNSDNESTTGYVYVDMDFFQVTPQYYSYDIVPVMRHITGSGSDGDGDYVEVASVEFWDEMDLTVDEDTFQIGQNTNKIIQDISTFSKLVFNVISTETQTTTGYIVPDGFGGTEEWSGGAAELNWNRIDEYPDVDGDGALVSVDQDGDGSIDIYEFETLLEVEEVTGIEVFVYSKRQDTAGIGISFDINLGGWQGADTIIPADGAYSWQSVSWAGLTGTPLEFEALQLKMTAPAIGGGGFMFVETIYIKVIYKKQSYWTKYMAREFKGKHCIDVLRAILLLEGGEWMADYSNNQIKLIKKADFEDSGITLDQTDYSPDWEFEDQCNQIKYVYVWGKRSIDSVTKTILNIKASAFDPSVEGENSVQIIDDTIWTNAEAQEIADTQLALLKDKRPSIRIPLNGVQADLEMGTYVNITMARPTIGAADYPIRMIQRKRRGKTGIETIIYVGFGETDWDEKIIKAINLVTSLAQKSLSDQLTSSPYDVGMGG